MSWTTYCTKGMEIIWNDLQGLVSVSRYVSHHPTKQGIFHLQQIWEGDVKPIPKKGHLPTPDLAVLCFPVFFFWVYGCWLASTWYGAATASRRTVTWMGNKGASRKRLLWPLPPIQAIDHSWNPQNAGGINGAVWLRFAPLWCLRWAPSIEDDPVSNLKRFFHCTHEVERQEDRSSFSRDLTWNQTWFESRSPGRSNWISLSLLIFCSFS